jgi:uncharacterized protein
MLPEIARKIIRNFLSNCDQCSYIQFFGGEPTLNLSGIKAIIEEIYKMVAEGSLKNKPRFGIVTNGVLVDFKETIDFIENYGIETTVSLDGPAQIHNALRPTTVGTPTYKKATETVSALLKRGVPLALETVYTSFHVKQGFSIVDLFKFCRDLGVRKLIFDTAYPPAPQELNPVLDPFFNRLLVNYQEAVDWWFQSLIDGEKNIPSVYLKDLLLPLLEGKSAVNLEGGCLAGKNDFAVGPEGDVFACQLFYSYPNYRIGNVLTGDIQSKMLSFPVSVYDFPSCKDCFARYWCQPCAALNYLWGDIWNPPARVCSLRRSVVQKLGHLAFASLEVPDNEITRVLHKSIFSKEK